MIPSLDNSVRCSCDISNDMKDNLPSLDDYIQSGLTITYLPSPR